MAVNGLMASAKPYPLFIDTRVDLSAQAMINDLNQGDIDSGILWGPIAGYLRQQGDPPLHVIPLVKERPDRNWCIGSAWASGGPELEAVAQRLIQENQPEINKILFGYGLPLLDENNQPISAEAATKSP